MLKILQTKPNFSKTKNIRRKLIPVPKSHDQALSPKQHLFWGWSIPLNVSHNEKECRSPKANTCSCVLRLPVFHSTYASFKDDMTFSILDTKGFDILDFCM